MPDKRGCGGTMGARGGGCAGGKEEEEATSWEKGTLETRGRSWRGNEGRARQMSNIVFVLM